MIPERLNQGIQNDIETFSYQENEIEIIKRHPAFKSDFKDIDMVTKVLEKNPEKWLIWQVSDTEFILSDNRSLGLQHKKIIIKNYEITVDHGTSYQIYPKFKDFLKIYDIQFPISNILDDKAFSRYKENISFVKKPLKFEYYPPQPIPRSVIDQLQKLGLFWHLDANGAEQALANRFNSKQSAFIFRPSSVQNCLALSYRVASSVQHRLIAYNDKVCEEKPGFYTVKADHQILYFSPDIKTLVKKIFNQQ